VSESEAKAGTDAVHELRMAGGLAQLLKQSGQAITWLQFFLGWIWREHRKEVGSGTICEGPCSTCMLLFEAGKAANLDLSGSSVRIECDRCKRPVSDAVPKSTKIDGSILCAACVGKGTPEARLNEDLLQAAQTQRDTLRLALRFLTDPSLYTKARERQDLAAGIQRVLESTTPEARRAEHERVAAAAAAGMAAAEGS
jgi:hypothetical protein